MTNRDPISRAQGNLAYVHDLAMRQNHALGFLPWTVYPKAQAEGRLKIVTENGWPCGFILHGPPRAELRIYQTAVEPAQRLKEHGRELFLSTLTAGLADDVEALTWICASDLPANQFWQRISSEPTHLAKRKSASRRDLFHYRHVLPRGTELEAYLEDQLKNSTLWKIAQFQGISQTVETWFKRRFRKTR